ncbi:MAG: amidase [Pseudomonadota bacterium]
MTMRRRDMLLGASGLCCVSATGYARSKSWYDTAAKPDEQLTTVDAVERALDRIAARDSVLQSIAWLNPNAMEEAATVDRMMRADAAGPLAGMTILAKSTFDVKGAATDGSNESWAREFTSPALDDAVTVSRVKAAGAVLLGKGAADDFGWGGDGTASATGQVWNPRYPDRERFAGGSSGGGAAAVAAGFCDAAFGTDDGGSNRIPAHYCGVLGVKTTFGFVPRTGVIPSWPWIDCHGPIAKNAATAARVLKEMVGPDPIDGHSRRSETSSEPMLAPPDLTNVRLGLVPSHRQAGALTTRQAEAFENGVALLKRSGAEIIPIDPPVTMANMSERLKAPGATPFDLAACANALVRYLDQRPEGAEELLPALLPAYQKYYSYLPAKPEELLAMSGTKYEESEKGLAYANQRDVVVSELGDFLAERAIDAMIWPTLGHEALKADEKWPDGSTPLSYANRLGLPEVSAPAFESHDGIPSGNISFTGLPFTDFRLLGLVHAFEKVRSL